MPLIVPGLNPTNNAQQEWMTKLLGKKITDSAPSDNLVSPPLNAFSYIRYRAGITEHICKSFAKTELPKDHRIVEPGAMLSQDHNPDRYVQQEEKKLGN